jgi:hypothetical protein
MFENDTIQRLKGVYVMFLTKSALGLFNSIYYPFIMACSIYINYNRYQIDDLITVAVLFVLLLIPFLFFLYRLKDRIISYSYISNADLYLKFSSLSAFTILCYNKYNIESPIITDFSIFVCLIIVAYSGFIPLLTWFFYKLCTFPHLITKSSNQPYSVSVLNWKSFLTLDLDLNNLSKCLLPFLSKKYYIFEVSNGIDKAKYKLDEPSIHFLRKFLIYSNKKSLVFNIFDMTFQIDDTVVHIDKIIDYQREIGVKLFDMNEKELEVLVMTAI